MAEYKLTTYQAANGPRAGVVLNQHVFDAADVTDRPAYASVLGILEDWPRANTIFRALAADPLPNSKSQTLDSVRLRAPVLFPSTIYCAGSNYRDHAAEMAARSNRPPEPDPKTNGGKPWFFLKAPRTITDPGAAISAADYTQKLDWEVELAAIIGTAAKNVSVERALDHVAGYTAANDLSARDFSRRANVSETSSFKSDWTGHKSFDGACPLGPWIVPAGDIPDPQNLALKLWVNDAIKQDSNTGNMTFTIAEQIAHLSIGMTLYPGDIILTGTPAGVGSGRNEFLRPGDTVKIEIERIGTLTNRIV